MDQLGAMCPVKIAQLSVNGDPCHGGDLFLVVGITGREASHHPSRFLIYFAYKWKLCRTSFSYLFVPSVQIIIAKWQPFSRQV
jgi:hypothetical protein